MQQRKLRAVPPQQEKPAAAKRPGRPLSKLVSAVDSSEVEMLVILRRKLAAQIDEGVSAHALAPMIRQLRQIDQDIRGLEERAAELAEAKADAAGYDDADDDTAFDSDAI